jgi:hypothetical protein
MASSDRDLITHFDVPIPPDLVNICTPATGTAVKPDFDAKGELTSPDNNITSCDVNSGEKPVPPPPISYTIGTPKQWTASFTGVNLHATPVPLTAQGDGGGKYCVMITVSATAPAPAPAPSPANCVGVSNCSPAVSEQQTSGSEPTVIIRSISVKRRDPAEPGGYALRLEYRGTAKAAFTVGGKLPAPEEPVQECVAGEHRAKVVNEGQDWYAVFQNVRPGDYLLIARTKSKVTDQVRIQIAATK